MKVNFKAIGKGVVAAGTLIGGAILAFQTKAGLKEAEEFEPTLEPLGSEPQSDGTNAETETEETETEPEENEEE